MLRGHGGLGLQRVIAFFDSTEKLIGLVNLADEQSHELHPLSLSQRVEFLIAQMGNQLDARFLDGIIAATLRGRNEDDVGVGRQHHLGVEVALHTNLHDATVLHPLQDVGVEEVLRARNALHHVMGIEHREVRQLQHRHHNGTTHGHLHPRIALGHRRLVARNQRKALFLPNIHQTDAGRVAHGEARGVLHLHRLLCLTVRLTIRLPVRPFTRFRTTARQQHGHD